MNDYNYINENEFQNEVNDTKKDNNTEYYNSGVELSVIDGVEYYTCRHKGDVEKDKCDYTRYERPTETIYDGPVDYDSKCYLTTACMKHMNNNFKDDCDELMTLRCFRDKFVSKEDIKHYYEIAPNIVEKINSLNNNNEIYLWIYNTVVYPCVNAIKNKNYKFAYNRYKNSVLILENKFINNSYEKTLKKM